MLDPEAAPTFSFGGLEAFEHVEETDGGGGVGLRFVGDCLYNYGLNC